MTSPRGRGIQMNAGARRATGDLLLFLHADSALPPDFEQSIAAALERQSLQGQRPARCATRPDLQIHRSTSRTSPAPSKITAQTNTHTMLVGSPDAAGYLIEKVVWSNIALRARSLSCATCSPCASAPCAARRRWGCFASIQLAEERGLRAWALRESVRLRTRWRHAPYGDQALFIQRDLFWCARLFSSCCHYMYQILHLRIAKPSSTALHEIQSATSVPCMLPEQPKRLVLPYKCPMPSVQCPDHRVDAAMCGAGCIQLGGFTEWPCADAAIEPIERVQSSLQGTWRV